MLSSHFVEILAYSATEVTTKQSAKQRLFNSGAAISLDHAMAGATTKPSMALRAFHILLGLIAIGAAFVVIVEPGLGVLTLVLILSITLLVLGVSRLARGLSHKLFTKGHRVVDVIAGVLSIILGLVVLADPVLGASTLVLLLALAAMIYGITTIVLGAVVAKLPKWLRAFLVATGILTVIFSFVVLGFPALGLLTLVVMLTVSFLVNGVESIVSAL